MNDDPRDLQLLPIAGRLKCAHVNHVEALCDAEDVLVWSVAVTPTIEKLSVWELDGKHGWKSLPDIHSRANNPTSRMMRFAQLSTVKAFRQIDRQPQESSCLKNCRWLRYWEPAQGSFNGMVARTLPKIAPASMEVNALPSIADIPCMTLTYSRKKVFQQRLKLWRNRSVRLTVW